MIYNEFKNVMVQKLRAEKLLPIDPDVVLGDRGSRSESSGEPRSFGESLPMEAAPGGSTFLVDYIYEQPVAEIFNGLVPRYVEAQIFRILLESAAAEHAARMTAMDSATNNARDVIDKLTLYMNKVRQAASRGKLSKW